MAHQLLLEALRICFGFIDLVHRHNDRHASRFRVVDRLNRLRHHAIIGRHDQNDDVGRLGAPRTHGRKRLVTWRIEEGNNPTRRLDVVGADVLGNSAGLTCRHLRATDRIE